VSYAITGGTGAALFAIGATSGVVTTAAAIDREALGASKTIEVTATSADGSTAAQTFTITINDVNEFAVSTPADTNGAANAVDENVAIGTTVGVTAFPSPARRSSDPVSYAITGGTGAALFAIGATSGVVTTAAAIDREALGASKTIEGTATRPDGSTAAQTLTITHREVHESAVSTPPHTNGAANAVDENVAIGTTVGVTAFAADADATTNAVSYAITGGTGAALFAIGATSGVVTTAAAIDREALGASKTIEVTATSADGSTATHTRTNTINDVNAFAVSTPADTNGAANAVDENVALGTTVGVTAFASHAPSTTLFRSYAITGGTGAALFAIGATSGVVTTAAAIDREALGASKTIEVTATSADGSTAAQTFTITINDVNEFAVSTPADTNGAANAVDENVAIGTTVGVTAFASDAD